MHINKTNGKVYIGQTKKSYLSRWDNGKGYGYRSRFAKAIEKYGWDGFEHIPLIEGLFKSEADYFERFFIEFFDSQNPEFGYNLTAGGDENPLDNPVVRAKYDEAMKKVYADPEWQKNVREGAKKRSADPEYQKNHHEAMKKMHADPEYQKKQREAMKKVYADPKWQEAMKKLHADPEYQKNHREAMKKLHADPKYQKNHREAMKKLHADPEYQKNHREGVKKRSADPEWRKKVSEANRKKAQDLEWQKKNREAIKKLHADPKWQKNVREGAKKRCKKVLCVETKMVYNSLTEAAIAVNLKTSTPICLCCNGKQKTGGGYHWEYP